MLRFATRVGKMVLSYPLGITRSDPDNKSFIDQVCFVKIEGYRARSSFASLRTSTPSRLINMQQQQKKNLADIHPSRPHAWSITHNYYMASSVSGQDEPNRAV